MYVIVQKNEMKWKCIIIASSSDDNDVSNKMSNDDVS